MTMLLDHSAPCSQSVFAAVLGVNQSTVSRMISDGIINDGESLGAWIKYYFAHIRMQAAGRLGSEVGGLDLVQERAALARSQRIAQDLKNAVAKGEYAPIGLLADVLGTASSAVVDRFEQLEGALRKTCPDLPDEAWQTIQQVISAARNEWARSTEQLVCQALDDSLAAAQEIETDSIADDGDDAGS